jgi:hypothetical protein
MSQRVNLPPGCMGFKASDGTRYTAKPGTSVIVEDRHIPALRAQDYASAGLVDAGPEKFFSVRQDDGRWCKPCRRVWNRWNHVCPRCGEDTVPESEMPRDLPAGPYVP